MAFQHLNNTSYTFGSHSVQVLVPERREVAAWYEAAKTNAGSPPDPYWTQVWAAAIGLCEFLSKNLHVVQQKKILELAAGLGLPSLWASHHAHSVIGSDYLPEAVTIMEQSRVVNHIENLTCCLLDWNTLPENLETDVLLLSDINYESAQFEQLLLVINRFVKANTTVILSTPQRLVAKPFIERLLPIANRHEQVDVWNGEKQVPISVLVL